MNKVIFWWYLFVFLSVCKQDNTKTTWPISIKNFIKGVSWTGPPLIRIRWPKVKLTQRPKSMFFWARTPERTELERSNWCHCCQPGHSQNLFFNGALGPSIVWLTHRTVCNFFLNVPVYRFCCLNYHQLGDNKWFHTHLETKHFTVKDSFLNLSRSHSKHNPHILNSGCPLVLF